MIKNGFKLSATDSYCSDLFPQYAGYCEPKVRCNLYFVREIVFNWACQERNLNCFYEGYIASSF